MNLSSGVCPGSFICAVLNSSGENSSIAHIFVFIFRFLPVFKKKKKKTQASLWWEYLPQFWTSHEASAGPSASHRPWASVPWNSPLAAKVDKFRDICGPSGLGQKHPAWWIVSLWPLFIAGAYHVIRNHMWDVLSQGVHRKSKECTGLVHFPGQNQMHLDKARSDWLDASRKAVGASVKEGKPHEVLLCRGGWS